MNKKGSSSEDGAMRRISGIIEKQSDLDILDILQENGRLSFKEIADELDASIGYVSSRVNDLIDHEKVSFVCWYDPWKCGMDIFAQVKISIRPIKKFDSVVERLYDIEEISFIARISGHFDLEINVICNDLKHLNDLLDDPISITEGVYETQTLIYQDLIKYKHLSTQKLY